MTTFKNSFFEFFQLRKGLHCHLSSLKNLVTYTSFSLLTICNPCQCASFATIPDNFQFIRTSSVCLPRENNYDIIEFLAINDNFQEPPKTAP